MPGIGRFTTFDKLINNKQEPLENNNYLYCCNDPINYFDDSGYDYRPIGVGIQVDGSVALGPAGIGIGLEIVVYWDEAIKGDQPVALAVYAYTEGAFSLKLSDYSKESILNNIEPLVADLESLSKGLTAKTFSEVTNYLNARGSVTGSALLVTGNEEFNDVGDYTGAFHTTSINIWRAKGFYSASEKCQTYGAGVTVLGNTTAFGISYSNSNYALVCSSVYNEKAWLK